MMSTRALGSALRKTSFSPIFVRSQVVSSLRNIGGKRTVFRPSFVGKRAVPFVNTKILNKQHPKLPDGLSGKSLSLKASFSNDVKYQSIAPFVGLNPLVRNMQDVPLFNLHRSRIPTALFKDIVKDIDILLIQYGPLKSHGTEVERSRCLAPIFNRLVAQFGRSIKNTPESLVPVDGRTGIKTRGKTECHFKIFGAIAIMFVEVELEIGSDEECRDAIAQVIVECDACDWDNMHIGIRIPIYGILCNGRSFQFFIFDGSMRTRPYKFSMGVVPGRFRVTELRFLGPLPEPTARQFIHSLRPICETIFNLLLVAYIISMKEMRDRSITRQWKVQGRSLSVDSWDKALEFAEEALGKSQDAEMLRQDNSIDEADSITESALKALELSINAVPIAGDYTIPPLMDGWNDNEVMKV